MASKAITFTEVSKIYRGKAAVERVSFEVDRGCVMALLGPNGAGKTTSISMMLGLRKPTLGTVQLFGKDPRLAHHRKSIGAMLQQVGLPGQMSVQQVLQLFRSYYDAPLDLAALLKLADLTAEAKQTATKLSGGQQRRLQFAISMAGNPDLLFLDEPTTAMDVASRRIFWAALKTWASEQQRTIILTTHHLDEADAIADRILLMNEGSVVADGSSAELKQQSGFSFVSCVAGATVTPAALQALPGVDSMEWSGRQLRIRTRSSDTVLRALIDQRLDVANFQVTQGRLEDAFIALTGSSTPLLQDSSVEAM